MLRVIPHCRGLGQRLLSHRFLTPLGYHHVCPEPCHHPPGQVTIGGHDKNLEYMKKRKKEKGEKSNAPLQTWHFAKSAVILSRPNPSLPLFSLRRYYRDIYSLSHSVLITERLGQANQTPNYVQYLSLHSRRFSSK